MMNNEAKGDGEGITIQTQRLNSPTTWTDIVQIATRADGSLLMTLISSLPDHQGIENHRTVVGSETVQSLIDLLCQSTGYYPKKPRKKKE